MANGGCGTWFCTWPVVFGGQSVYCGLQDRISLKMSILHKYNLLKIKTIVLRATISRSPRLPPVCTGDST